VLAATAIAACLVASSGCPAPEPPPQPVPIERFSAVYERSGGLKPMPQRVVIRPGREAETATRSFDENSEVGFTISVLKAKQLRAGLSQPRFRAFDTTLPGNCADCYLYTIGFRGHEISFPQSEIPGFIRKTVARFEALYESHLPRH
jgi:hypothetical protein